MLSAAAHVSALILVITYFSVQCYSLEIHYENIADNDFKDDEDLFAPETIQYAKNHYEESLAEIPQPPQDGILNLLFGNMYRDEDFTKTNKLEEQRNDQLEIVRSRVVRQAYHSQAPLYPQLPSGSPYNQYQPNSNYNQNSQWKPNNYSQQGYPTNGGVSNFYPTAQQNSSYGHNPYNSRNPSQSQTPYYNNIPSTPSYPGYRPPNSTTYNAGSSRPPYNQHVNTNSYPGYPTKTPSYRPSNTSTPYYPSQRPPYSPIPHSNPSTYRPPYNNQNTSNWPGNTGPNSRPYNGQNPQYYNSSTNYHYGQPNSSLPYSVPGQGHFPSNGGQYPAYNNNNARPYGQNPQSFNSNPQGPNQNLYNNPYNGPQGANSYTGNPHGSDTFNLSNGYNPTIPNHPPYGSGPGRYPPGSNGTAHDPTRVSPEYFSYPH